MSCRGTPGPEQPVNLYLVLLLCRFTKHGMPGSQDWTAYLWLYDCLSLTLKVVNDSAENQMRILTETLYETSKYLLINNKKLNSN